MAMHRDKLTDRQTDRQTDRLTDFKDSIFLPPLYTACLHAHFRVQTEFMMYCLKVSNMFDMFA